MFKITQKIKPLVLVILDGWGIAPHSEGNAITLANCTNFNKLWFTYPHTLLTASGQSVGIAQGDVGNSEVGHINIGAGKIVFQSELRIDIAIEDGSFYQNEAIAQAAEHAKKNNSNVHVMGLVGSGSVHSKTNHLLATIQALQNLGIEKEKVKIHLFTDGRDSPPTSAKAYIEDLLPKLTKFGQVATISGRYYAMDRDNHWERTEQAYKAITGTSELVTTDPTKTIMDSYAEGITDEFLKPTIVCDASNHPIGPVADNDAIVFFNYRPDRTRQLTNAFMKDKLNEHKTASGEDAKTFKRNQKVKNLFFVTMTQYEKGLPVGAIAFDPKEVDMPLARVFAERDQKQLHIAETEKYAHVTYFFNGGREQPFLGEDRVLIDSKRVATFDLAPEMAASEITKALISRIQGGSYDFIVVNYANADMVGHTGNLQATIKAVEIIDFHLGILAKSVLSVGGALVVTADHGNAEVMINPRTKQPETSHDASPVPCIMAAAELAGKSIQLPKGILADVAPTCLAMLNIPKPAPMTGRNLLE